MHQGMGGPHTFKITVPSNDPAQLELALTVTATYPLP
jgi:hypothetical protein